MLFRSHACIAVYGDGERMIHRRKPVIAPGEMETLILEKRQLAAYRDLRQITVTIEEA